MGVSPRQSGPLQNLQRAMLLILLCNGEHEELPTARPQQEEMVPIGSWGWEELQRWPPTNHSPTVSTRATERIPTFCSHSNMGVWMSTTISEVRVKLRGVATFWCVNRWTRSWMYHQGSYENSSMVTKTSAGIDSLPYRMGGALQNIPQNSLGSIWMVTSRSRNGLCFIPQRPGPWTPSQLFTLVPFAVANSGYTGCLGISWRSVISGWFMWRRKARFSHLRLLPYGAFLSISYLSLGWHLGHFLLQLAFSNSSQRPGRSATAEGQAMLDWDKVHWLGRCAQGPWGQWEVRFI